MYLVGDLSSREYFPMATIKNEISRDDLVRCKKEDWFQVINMKTGQYFNPERNVWEDFQR